MVAHARKPGIDVATLPAWPLVAGIRGSGPDVELYAAATDADALLVSLAGDGPFLAAAKPARLTGRLVAPSRAAALVTVVAQAGVSAAPIKIAGSAPQVDLSFSGAPQQDLLRLLGSVMRLAVVIDGSDLPDLDIAVKHAPADGVLAAVAALDDRVEIHDGELVYLVRKGTTLPPVPAVPTTAAIDLDLRGATVTDAFAALRAAGVAVGACGDAKLTLRLGHVKPADAIRALEVAGHVVATPGDGGCAVAEAASPNLDGAKLEAIAVAGKRSFAVISRGSTSNIVGESAAVAISSEYFSVTAGNQTIGTDLALSVPPVDPAAWLASLERTSLVIRVGKTWSAVAETGGKRVFVSNDNFSVPSELRSYLEISPAGIDVRGEHIGLAP